MIRIKFERAISMIRQAEISDLAACVELIRASFLTVAAEFGLNADNAPRFSAFAATEARLERQMTTEHRPMYVYCLADEIVGYYSLALKENRRCELNNLCVGPACRHQGIGGELLKNAFETARKLNCSQMSIGIIEENKVLRRWYETFGFVHTGTRKFGFFPFTCGYLEKKL